MKESLSINVKRPDDTWEGMTVEEARSRGFKIPKTPCEYLNEELDQIRADIEKLKSK